jgi:phosphopantothenoylcysteine decarboxylase/phosphopantothenate--cysteine ligase
MRALQKLERKSCDLIVSNSAEAIHAARTSVEVLARNGRVLGVLEGRKEDVAVGIVRTIEAELIQACRD